MNHEVARLRPLLESDLLTVLSWRNHPSIKMFMLTQHEITLDEHLIWFESANKDKTKKLMVFEENNIALGFVSFNSISKNGASNWGFYIAPESPKGLGKKLGYHALNFAFFSLELNKICGQALSFNQRSINLHKSLGFQQEGVMRDQHFDGENYHDLICFGILKQEWKNIILEE